MAQIYSRGFQYFNIGPIPFSMPAWALPKREFSRVARSTAGQCVCIALRRIVKEHQAEPTNDRSKGVSAGVKVLAVHYLCTDTRETPSHRTSSAAMFSISDELSVAST